MANEARSASMLDVAPEFVLHFRLSPLRAQITTPRNTGYDTE